MEEVKKMKQRYQYPTKCSFEIGYLYKWGDIWLDIVFAPLIIKKNNYFQALSVL